MRRRRASPHDGRMAEVYEWRDGRLVFVGYTRDDSMPAATWDQSMMAWIIEGNENEPARQR